MAVAGISAVVSGSVAPALRFAYIVEMKIGLDGLTADRFEALGAYDFEELCADLIRRERDRRHDPSAIVSGPPKPFVSEGGFDLWFEVRSAPGSQRPASGRR